MGQQPLAAKSPITMQGDYLTFGVVELAAGGQAHRRQGLYRPSAGLGQVILGDLQTLLQHHSLTDALREPMWAAKPLGDSDVAGLRL